jgi:hypothetical protein
MKIYIFANCHGQHFKGMLEKYGNDIEVEHDVSYANLQNFDNLRSKFEDADILIIQPVQQYEEFKLEKLEKILKSDCLVIKIPFIRFRGFWPDLEEKKLAKFNENSIMFFPNLESTIEVEAYLNGSTQSYEKVTAYFQKEMRLLKDLETNSDILFVDYFLEHYQKIPTFNDPYHPTWPFVCYLAKQLFNIIEDNKNIKFRGDNFDFNYYSKESVYFKPIVDSVASALKLEFDLDNYYIQSRTEYLSKVLNYENNIKDVEVIKNRQELQQRIFLVDIS